MDSVITILCRRPNKRGDIFTRLMSDMFHSLGYEQLRFNIIRLVARLTSSEHIAPSDYVAECKAEADPIGELISINSMEF